MNNNNTTTVKNYISNLILKENPLQHDTVIYKYTGKHAKNKFNYLITLKNKQLKIYNLNTPTFQQVYDDEIDQVLNSFIACIYDETAESAILQVI